MQQLPDILLTTFDKLAGTVPVTPIAALLGLFLLAQFLKIFERGKRSKFERRKAVPSPPAISNLCQKQLLTPNEQEFFARLCRALPEHHVFPQVAFNALLDTNNFMPWGWRSLRRQFHSLVADYVICNRAPFQVVAIVELDDKTHDHKKEKDAERDAMLHAAGYRTVRFESKEKPSEAQIAALFCVLQKS
jgi:hypothetical protein